MAITMHFAHFPLSSGCRVLAAITLAVAISGCSAVERLANVGSPPALSAIDDPTAQPGYRPVQMPMPDTEPAIYEPNSLWRSGSRAFFRDQRAAKVGDILTVRVDITDRAEFENETSRSRVNAENLGAQGSIGNSIQDFLAEGTDLSAIVDLDSDGSSAGAGSIEREETLTTIVAAVVTQVLPNGNLVIEGRQEVRVNFEVRELIIAGVVRPEDIDAQNMIDSAKIAEARISYGGRGQITDVQQPRYGQQVLDILLPF